MTKKQLLKKLEKVSDETEIILSIDEEGNTYYKLREIYNEEGLKFFNYDGINLINKDDIEEYGEEYGMNEKEYNKAKECVVLYP